MLPLYWAAKFICVPLYYLVPLLGPPWKMYDGTENARFPIPGWDRNRSIKFIVTKNAPLNRSWQ